MKYCLGIDIGGTKTAVCIANETLKPVKTKTFPTEPQKGAGDLVKRIDTEYNLLRQELYINKSDVILAGVACPGPLDLKNGKIIHIATMGFKDVPITDMLKSELKLPVFLENDANCAALAESVIGKGKGKNPCVYVTLSTGIGCGIVANGKILSGAYSSAGEIGHLTVVPDGKECPCGKKGCLELYSSGTAISRTASKLLDEEITTKEVFSLALQGNKKMLSVINDAADKLGLALSSVYHIIDPEIIVLGGSVTKDYKIFETTLRKAILKYTQPVKNRVFNIEVSSFGGEQVVLGALINADNVFKEERFRCQYENAKS